MAKKKAKSYMKPHAALPKRAPRKSGRRGIGPPPLDAKEDFENPVKQEPEAELLVTPDNPKKPKQQRLPSMEDAKIEALESLAESYAEIRDRRQELTTEEVRLKKELLDAMHAEHKTDYVHAGVEIHVIVEKEKVRVRIHKDEDKD